MTTLATTTTTTKVSICVCVFVCVQLLEGPVGGRFFSFVKKAKRCVGFLL